MRHFPRQSTVIRVELGLPNGTITVDREAASHHRANDVYVAIREALTMRAANWSSTSAAPHVGFGHARQSLELDAGDDTLGFGLRGDRSRGGRKKRNYTPPAKNA